MKTELSIEESAYLIELGVDIKIAKIYTPGVQKATGVPGIYRIIEDGKPILTLSDILSILPKEIKIHRDGDTLSMIYHCGQWRVGYTNCAYWCEHTKVAPELIDALNQLLIWAIENNHVNLNSDKK